MSRIFKCVLAGLAMFATLGAQSEAALVRATFDSFANTTLTSTPVITAGGATVNRTISGAGVSVSGTDLVVQRNSTATVTYSVTGGTFNDVYQALGGPGTFSGFSFNASVTGAPQGQMALTSVLYSGTPGLLSTTLAAGDNDFLDTALSNATSVTISFTNDNGGPAGARNLLIGSVSAVPEPSALLLVGSILGVGLARRRRS